MKKNKEDNEGNKIQELVNDELIRKDKNLQRRLLEDNLKMFEAKIQNLVVMFDSPKLFKLQNIFK